MSIRILAAALLFTLSITTARAQNPDPQLARHAAAPEPAPRLLDKPARLSVEALSLEAALLELTRTSGVPLAFSPARIPAAARVTCACTHLSVREALDRLLIHTTLDYSELVGQVVLFPVEAHRGRDAFAPFRIRRLGVLASTVVQGIRELLPLADADTVIAGTVVSASTGEPIEGVHVAIQGSGRGVVTGADGRFRVIGLDRAQVTLRATRLGYRTLTRAVTPGNRNLRLLLEETAIELDEVVVTGPLTSTARRKLASSVSVLREDDLQRINATSILDLFDGQVPGVSVLDYGVGGEWQDYIMIRGATGLLGALVGKVKILVDGVETNTTGLAAISARNVERVEVIRGPQASTMYGSEAAGGVIQIFTKKGGAGEREQFAFSAGFGAVRSPYVDETPQIQDYSASLSGSLGGGTYHIGAGHRSEDGYVPNYDQTFTTGSFGFQRSLADFDLSMIARLTEKRFGFPGTAGILFDLYREGSLPSRYTLDLDDRYEFRAATLGAHLTYAPFEWWHNEVHVGTDLQRQRGQQVDREAGTQEVSVSDYSVPTLRYSASFTVPERHGIESTIIAGFDWGERNRLSFRASAPDNGEPFATTTGGWVWEENFTKRGVFGSVQVGIADRLFLSGGVRTDDHTNFGADFGGWSTNPRVGATYVLRVGDDWTLKPRVSWGRGIDAPTLRMRGGGAPYALPNPEIGPQTVTGWEVGLDQYVFAGRLFIEGTYYSQRTEDAISYRFIDYPYPFQYINGGEIANRGAELQVRWTDSPVDLNLTVSANDNEVLSVPENWGGSDQVGKPVSYPAVPTLTGAFRATYMAGRLLRRSSPADVEVGFHTSYIGRRWARDEGEFYRALRDGTYSGSQADYVRWHEGFARAGLFTRLALPSRLSLTADVDNLFDGLEQEVPGYVTHGRRIMISLSRQF